MERTKSRADPRRSEPLAGYSFVYSRLVSRDGTAAAVNDDFRHVTSNFQRVTQSCASATDRALPVNPVCRRRSCIHGFSGAYSRSSSCSVRARERNCQRCFPHRKSVSLVLPPSTSNSAIVVRIETLAVRRLSIFERFRFGGSDAMLVNFRSARARSNRVPFPSKF